MWGSTIIDRDRERCVHDLELLAQMQPPREAVHRHWHLPRLRRHAVHPA